MEAQGRLTITSEPFFERIETATENRRRKFVYCSCTCGTKNIKVRPYDVNTKKKSCGYLFKDKDYIAARTGAN